MGLLHDKKNYNKMIQSLESKSVRSSIGCHWKDSGFQTNTRLAAARDSSTNRGLTRVEATFYLPDGDIPSDDFIERTLHQIVEYIPKELVYSTPFCDTWKAYCDSFKHSLVCVDRANDIGLVVYSFNEFTKKIIVHVYEKRAEKENWCLEKLTLNGNLPLDVI